MHHSAKELLPFVLLLTSCDTSAADSRLADTLEERLAGDRTHACVAAAVIDHGVARAIQCADPASRRDLDFDTAFEIGSISKTMTGTLLAEAARRGELRLDDRLAAHLPEETMLPAHGDTPVTLLDLATHTSGLPSLPARMRLLDADNPYAALTDADLLASLADVTLDAAPGEHWAYSNFGFMLLSRVVTEASGQGLPTLLKERLFQPLGMQAFIGEPASGVTLAVGHDANGTRVEHWDFPPDLAGFGGVRASLDDMVRYAEAVLGDAPTPLAQALQEATRLQREPSDGPRMGLGWVLGELSGRELLLHDGGTGGFSSFIALDRERRRAVVLLSDTSWGTVGGIAELALHLLAPEAQPLPKPRLEVRPPATLVAALAGRYTLAELEVELSEHAGALRGTVGGETVELGYDSHGDFDVRELDALLTPVQLETGDYTFDWKRQETVTRAERKP